MKGLLFWLTMKALDTPYWKAFAILVGSYTALVIGAYVDMPAPFLYAFSVSLPFALAMLLIVIKIQLGNFGGPRT